MFEYKPGGEQRGREFVKQIEGTCSNVKKSKGRCERVSRAAVPFEPSTSIRPRALTTRGATRSAKINKKTLGAPHIQHAFHDAPGMKIGAIGHLGRVCTGDGPEAEELAKELRA